MNIENIKVAGYTYPINDKDGETDITKLKSKLADLTSFVDTVDADTQRALSDIDDVESEVKSLQSLFSSLSVTVGKNYSDIASLTSSVSELTEKMDAVYKVLNEMLNKGVFTAAISASLYGTTAICGNAVCGKAICGNN